jgi:hypothetical protein
MVNLAKTIIHLGRIAQLVRALLLHRRGRRFESCSAHWRTPNFWGF